MQAPRDTRITIVRGQSATSKRDTTALRPSQAPRSTWRVRSCGGDTTSTTPKRHPANAVRNEVPYKPYQRGGAPFVVPCMDIIDEEPLSVTRQSEKVGIISRLLAFSAVEAIVILIPIVAGYIWIKEFRKLRNKLKNN